MWMWIFELFLLCRINGKLDKLEQIRRNQLTPAERHAEDVTAEKEAAAREEEATGAFVTMLIFMGAVFAGLPILCMILFAK